MFYRYRYSTTNMFGTHISDNMSRFFNLISMHGTANMFAMHRLSDMFSMQSNIFSVHSTANVLLCLVMPACLHLVVLTICLQKVLLSTFLLCKLSEVMEDFSC